MTKKLFLVLCLFIATQTPTALWAQNDYKLPGEVVLLNGKYKTGKTVYVQGASIKSHQATPTLSDANGKFTLLFADRPGGDVARLYVSKSGMEVINKKVLDAAAVIGRTEPLRILMCDADELAQRQMEFYDIIVKNTNTDFDKKISTLQKDNAESKALIKQLSEELHLELRGKNEALAALAQQRDKALQNAQELADRFATTHLDDQSQTYIRAYELFQKGAVRAAIALLDSIDLKKRLETNYQQKTKEKNLIDTLQKSVEHRNTQMQQDIAQCMLLARMNKSISQWAAADSNYAWANRYNDLQNYDNLFEYAVYLQEQNQFHRAEPFYQTALKLCKTDNERAATLNNLAVLQDTNNQMAVAEKNYQEALSIYRDLAKTNPQAYLPDVAMTLNNLASLQYANNQMAVAEKNYQEATATSLGTNCTPNNTPPPSNLPAKVWR